eukprot:681922-Pyramimonas_sp.AAC.1
MTEIHCRAEQPQSAQGVRGPREAKGAFYERAEARAAEAVLDLIRLADAAESARRSSSVAMGAGRRGPAVGQGLEVGPRPRGSA